MTTTPDIALPPCAHTYGWDSSDSERRTVYGDARIVESASLAVTAFASRRRDGSIVDEDFDRALVYVDRVEDDGTYRGCVELTPAAARQLATALLAAAELDGWVAK